MHSIRLPVITLAFAACAGLALAALLAASEAWKGLAAQFAAAVPGTTLGNGRSAMASGGDGEDGKPDVPNRGSGDRASAGTDGATSAPGATGGGVAAGEGGDGSVGSAADTDGAD